MQNSNYTMMASRSDDVESARSYEGYARIQANPANIGQIIEWLSLIFDHYYTFLDVFVPSEDGSTKLIHITDEKDRVTNRAELEQLKDLVRRDLTLSAVLSQRWDILTPSGKNTSKDLTIQVARYEIMSGWRVRADGKNAAGERWDKRLLNDTMDNEYWVPFEEAKGSYYSHKAIFKIKRDDRTRECDDAIELLERFAADFLGTVDNVEDVYFERSNEFEAIASGYLSFEAEDYPKYLAYLKEMMRFVHNHPDMTWEIKNLMFEKPSCQVIGFRFNPEEATVEPLRWAFLD